MKPKSIVRNPFYGEALEAYVQATIRVGQLPPDAERKSPALYEAHLHAALAAQDALGSLIDAHCATCVADAVCALTADPEDHEAEENVSET